LQPAEFIESRISLISKSGNRYVGTLVEINSEAGTVSLGDVRVFGTEGRNGGDDENPPSDVVCEQIVFRASDLKDLRIEELANEMAPPAMSQDPTIIASLQSQSRKDGAPQEQQRQQYATVSDASITTTVSHIVCVGAVYIDTIWTYVKSNILP
jgi:protein LSM14